MCIALQLLAGNDNVVFASGTGNQQDWDIDFCCVVIPHQIVCQFLACWRKRNGCFVNVFECSVGDGVDDAYAALGMPDNSNVAESNFLIEVTSVILGFLVVIY